MWLSKNQIDILNEILEYLGYLKGEKATELNNKLYNEILKDYEVDEETPLHKALIDEIDMVLECYEDYENVELSENTKIDIAWNIINYEDNLWEELNNTICDYIRKELVKNYMNNKKESDK